MLMSKLINFAAKLDYRNVRQPKIHKEILTEELFLPAEDGTLLHTLIYRSKTAEIVPTIVERTGYKHIKLG